MCCFPSSQASCMNMINSSFCSSSKNNLPLEKKNYKIIASWTVVQQAQWWMEGTRILFDQCLTDTTKGHANIIVMRLPFVLIIMQTAVTDGMIASSPSIRHWYWFSMLAFIETEEATDPSNRKQRNGPELHRTTVLEMMPAAPKISSAQVLSSWWHCCRGTSLPFSSETTHWSWSRHACQSSSSTIGGCISASNCRRLGRFFWKV